MGKTRRQDDGGREDQSCFESYEARKHIHHQHYASGQYHRNSMSCSGKRLSHGETKIYPNPVGMQSLNSYSVRNTKSAKCQVKHTRR